MYPLRRVICGVLILSIVLTGTAAYADNTQISDYNKEIGVIRNKNGDVIGVDVTDEPDMTNYDTVDFDMLIRHPLWKEYEKLDFTYNKEKKQIYFSGMPVQSIADQYTEENMLYYDRDEFFRNILDDVDSNKLELFGEYDESETEPEDNEEVQWISLVAQRDQEYKLQYFTFIRNN